MQTYTVSFFGHRIIEDPLHVEQRLKKLIRIQCEITYTNLFKMNSPESSGNDPTPLKTFDIKGFYSSRLATDSKMTAKNQDALLFTAEHLLILGTKLIVPLAENCRDDKSPYLIQPVNIC